MKPLSERTPCAEPYLFHLDPSVCGRCGLDLDRHGGTKPQDTEAARRQKIAMWKVLIDHGGKWSYHGGSPEGGEQLREHMGHCRIDWKHTEMPAMTTVAEFTDTFSAPDTKEVIGGMLWCVCGVYRYDEIVICDLSMGELIWLVAHADD